MTVPLTLLLFAAVVSTLAPRVLVPATWTYRHPRLGILAWQAVVLSVLTSALLLAVTALVPVHRVSFDLGHLLHACPEVLRSRYQALRGSRVRLLSAMIAAATLLALSWAVVVRGRAVRRGRRRQREFLGLLAHQQDNERGAHVVEHSVPLAYCVPGGGGRIVVTSAAVAALDEAQLDAVLAHEHAHLEGRHDLVLFGAEVASTAFPWSRLMRHARQQLSLLIEMLADDRGARNSGRHALATALVDLGQVSTAPEGALGAQVDSLVRVRRLLTWTPAFSPLLRTSVVLVSVLVGVGPWVIAVAPAWAARYGLCPLPR